jgi:hypothetical protein
MIAPRPPAEECQKEIFNGLLRRDRLRCLAFGGAFLSTIAAIYLINIAANVHSLFCISPTPSHSYHAWKAQRLQQLTEAGTPPQILILGSSRAMEIDPAQVQAVSGKRAFNFAVGGGNIVTANANLRYALNVGAKPSLVLLNVDESMLSNTPFGPTELKLGGHRGQFAALSRYDQCFVVLGILRSITLDSTMKSLRGLFDKPQRVRTDLWLGDNRAFLENGRMLRTELLRRKIRGTFDLQRIIAHDLLEHERAYRADPGKQFRENDETCVKHLKSLLDTARDNHIEVVVFTTPEHPAWDTYSRSEDRTRRHSAHAEMLSNECAARGFVFRAFRSLESIDGDPNEFWDATHQSSVNAARMINVLFAVPAASKQPGLQSDIECLESLESQLIHSRN